MRRFYLSIVTGRRRGPLAWAIRALLALGTVLYVTLHGLRRLCYRIGLLRSVRLPCRVVSVGNLTAGGTGKTPFVEHLARWFARKNIRVAVLARGYGRIPGGDDEDGLSELGLENIVRLTGADRVALGRRAVSEFRAEVVILDDGFQHYRIARDLDILLVDATDPFSGGRLLPLGLLREPVSAAKRADFIVLTRSDQAAPDDLALLRDRLAGLTSRPVVEAQHRPVAVRTLWNKKRHGTEWLKDRRLFAFCGIGNPEAFRRTLESLGGRIEKFLAFEDHHRYSALDLRRINAEAQEFMADTLVTTEKDAVKLDPGAFELPVAALRVEMEIVRGEERLESSLQALVQDLVPVQAAG